jgi:transposase
MPEDVERFLIVDRRPGSRPRQRAPVPGPSSPSAAPGLQNRDGAGSLFGVSVSYIYKALARRRRDGIATALPRTGRPGRKLDGHLEALATHVREHPDATLAELVDWPERERGVTVCIATMFATLDVLELSRKKRHAMLASRPGPMSLQRARTGAKPKAA